MSRLVPGVAIRMPEGIKTFDHEWDPRVMSTFAALRKHLGGEFPNIQCCIVREVRAQNAPARLAAIIGRPLSAAEITMWLALLPDRLPMDKTSLVLGRAQLAVAPTGKLVECALATEVFDQVLVLRTRDGRQEIAIGEIAAPTEAGQKSLQPSQWPRWCFCIARAGDSFAELKQTCLKNLDEEISDADSTDRALVSVPLVAAATAVVAIGLLHFTGTWRLDTLWGGTAVLAAGTIVATAYWICRTLRQSVRRKTQPLKKLRSDIANLPDEESYAPVPTTS